MLSKVFKEKEMTIIVTMYNVRGFCAGILVAEVDHVKEEDLPEALLSMKDRLVKGEIFMQFGGMTLPATELCLDVYEAVPHYRASLSVAFKR